MNTTPTFTLHLTGSEYATLCRALASYEIEAETEHYNVKLRLDAARPDADPEALLDDSDLLLNIEHDLDDVQALRARLLALSPVPAAQPESVLPCPVV